MDVATSEWLYATPYRKGDPPLKANNVTLLVETANGLAACRDRVGEKREMIAACTGRIWALVEGGYGRVMLREVALDVAERRFDRWTDGCAYTACTHLGSHSMDECE